MVDSDCAQYIEKETKFKKERKKLEAFETQRTFHISFLFCVLYIVSHVCHVCGKL